MNTIISQLQLDHIHLGGLFACLRDQVNRSLRETEDTPPNLHLIIDIIDYVQVYPEKWHHPVEQAVYQKLLACVDQKHNKVIHELVDEHELQSLATEAIRNRVIESFKQTQQLTIKNAWLLLQYAEGQLRHMKIEERKIFPLTKILLNNEDWRDIAQALESERSKKGVADAVIKEEYENLYNNIIDFHPLYTSRCNPFKAATR